MKIVAGSGNTNLNSFYSTIDPNPYSGISYYKLMQTDLDGKSTYSHVVTVNMGDGASLLIYPNPTADFVFITTPDNGPIKFQFVSAAGRRVTVPSFRTESTLRLDLSAIPTGDYYIQTTYRGISQTQAILKR